MATDLNLSAAVRENLLALKSTEALIARTQNRLSTGLKVASPIDDPRVFFEAKALTDNARDVGEKKEGVDQGINSVKTALEGIESIDSLVQQMKGLLISSRTATGSELASLVTQYNTKLLPISLKKAPTWWPCRLGSSLVLTACPSLDNPNRISWPCSVKSHGTQSEFHLLGGASAPPFFNCPLGNNCHTHGQSFP